jgi:ribosomal protein S18 acetylase RimI-like enzyme
MNEILIRPATEMDLSSILELLHQLAGFAHSTVDMDLGQVRKLHAEMLNCPQHYKNVVACLDGKVVGFISVIQYLSFFHKGGTGLINELIVSVEHRNAGIGKALVQWAVSVCRNGGMDEIEVGTERDNKRAIDFYKKAGFDEEYVLLGLEFKS